MKYENKAELIEKAKVLREGGMSYYKITKELGVKGHDTVRLWLDSDVREQRYAHTRHYQATHKDEVSACHKKHYQAHKEEYIERAKKWGEENHEKRLEICARYRETHGEELREKGREYHIAHKEERKQYYREHCEEINERNRKYQAEHRDECNARSKEYYENNKEQHRENCRKWAKENHERILIIQARYRKGHRDELNASERIRRARINEYDEILQADYDAILESQNGLCAYCNKMMLTEGNPHHPDYYNLEHVWPVSRNGAHVLDNFVYACNECNLKKGTKTIEEWKPSLLEKVGNGICGREKMKAGIKEL